MSSVVDVYIFADIALYICSLLVYTVFFIIEYTVMFDSWMHKEPFVESLHLTFTNYLQKYQLRSLNLV